MWFYICVFIIIIESLYLILKEYINELIDINEKKFKMIENKYNII